MAESQEINQENTQATMRTSENASLDVMTELRHAWGIFTLKETSMRTVSKNPEATIVGAMILCAPPLIKIVLAFIVLGGFNSPHYGTVFINFIAGTIALFAPFYLARGLYGGKGDVEEFFRILTYARFPQVPTLLLMIVPFLVGFAVFLDFLIDIWMLWVTHIVLTKIMHIDEIDSFKVVGMTFLGYLVLTGIFQLLF